MITDETRLNKLKDDLSQITGLAYYHKNDLVTLCPNCETDRFNKNRKHGHMYISKFEPIFHCYRCDYKGIIYKLFNDFRLDISQYIDTDKLIYKKDFTNVDKFINKEFNYNIKLLEDDFSNPNNLNKIEYIKQRIPNYEKYKSMYILDIGNFLNYNSINLDIDENFRKYLYSNFIGFLCARKSLLICRNIDSKSNFRYYKIELKKIFFKDIFTVELNKDSNKIALCEGIFDLFNLLESNKLQNTLNEFRCISTALSNSYTKSLISTLDYYKLPFSDEVTIFSDKDVQEYRYMNIFLNNACNRLILFYNKLEKDFGTTNIELIKVPINKYIKKEMNNAKEKKGVGV